MTAAVACNRTRPRPTSLPGSQNSALSPRPSTTRETTGSSRIRPQAPTRRQPDHSANRRASRCIASSRSALGYRDVRAGADARRVAASARGSCDRGGYFSSARRGTGECARQAAAVEARARNGVARRALGWSSCGWCGFRGPKRTRSSLPLARSPPTRARGETRRGPGDPGWTVERRGVLSPRPPLHD